MPKTGGAKGRKIGRTLRKPSHQRYNQENRREKNKARKAEKQKRKLEKLAKRREGKTE